MTAHDWWIIAPELAAAGLAALLVIADLALRNKRILAELAVIGLAAPLFFSLNLWFGWYGDTTDPSALFGAITADRFALFFHFLLIGVSAAVILASTKYLERMPGLRGEFLALMLFSMSGMMMLVSAKELVAIYVSLELTALPVAALAAFHRGARSVEAGLKFLVLSAIASALLLYGMVYIYGFTGSTNLEIILQRLNEIPSQPDQPFGSYGVLLGVVLIVAGFAFKMAVVPWQMWVPDVYEGSPTPLAAFLSVASKAAAFAVIIRVLYAAFGSEPLTQDWSGLIAALAAVTMTVGNLLALSQKNIKRLLGYSTVSQAGYMLAGVAAVSANSGSAGFIAGPQGVLYYLMGYAFTNLAVFLSVIAITHRTGNELISGLNGMGRRSPVVAMLLTVGLLSLLGVPPTVGFMSKAFVFSAAVNSGLIWLAVIGVVNTAVSAYYYLRIVRAMYFEEPSSDEPIRADLRALAATGTAAAGVAVFGIGPWFLLKLAEESLTIL